jgi:hypothetical protein
MWFTWLACALVLLVGRVRAAPPPATIAYLFQDGQAPPVAPTVLRDSASPVVLGDLTANTSTPVWVYTRQGVIFASPTPTTSRVDALGVPIAAGANAYIASVNTSAAFARQLVGAGGFTTRFRVRRTVDPATGTTNQLFGFGDFPLGTSIPVCDASDPRHGGFMMFEFQGGIMFDVLYQLPSRALSCARCQAYFAPGLTYTVVLVATNRSTTIYLSDTGTPVRYCEVFPPTDSVLNATRWAPNRLTVARPASSTRGFTGTLYQLEFFVGTIYSWPGVASDNLNTLASTVPPNSAPFVPPTTPTSLQVPEDTSVLVSFACSDADGDSALPRIAALPARGVLTTHLAQGTVSQFPVIANTSVVSYQPAPDDTTSTSFRYACIDSRGLVGREATVLVQVVPSNDAPVPRSRTVTVFR